MSSSKYNAHSKPILKKFHLLDVQDMFKRKALNFYYKLVKSSLPKYFKEPFTPIKQNEIHEHFTRSEDYAIPRVYHSHAENCLRVYLPKLLNEMNETDDSIHVLSKVGTHSLKGFSLYVKQYFVKNIDEICHIENCRNNCNQ